MLRLENVTKDYKVADTKVHALKNINLAFRKNEFVSILGPSGCGKTTTLNIIGGLDKYTNGDLFVNGISTKKYKGRDWDIYRNHRIGFIFQSYNLIPHQTVLENVSLALTISGISKKERDNRAKKALDEVGLSNQYNKKPNQLSGGQCQRVAIARALVNEPEILLADEPTGALDTKTSVQIMELIKKIAKDRLVIMVTHNPDLASKYSSRIINLLDGEVQSDSNPYSLEDEKKENKKVYKNEKAKMSFWTSFKLSAKNLWSKKKRTILVAIAGSIGIIGVASVLSISTGLNSYIDDMQDDMLSGNPIMVSEETYDLSALTSSLSTSEQAEIASQVGKVSVEYLIDEILTEINDGTSFTVSNDIDENYVQYVKDMPEEYTKCVAYNYGVGMENNLFTNFYPYSDDDNSDASVQSVSSIISNYTSLLSTVDGIGSLYSDYVMSLVDSVNELPATNDYIESQYSLVAGSMPEGADQMVLVLNDDDEVSDLILAELGYYTQNEYVQIVKDAKNDVDHDESTSYFDYDEILNKSFYFANASQLYSSNDDGSFNYNYSLSADDMEKVNIVGILEPNSDITYGCLDSGFYYTSDLAEEMIDTAQDDTSGLLDYLEEQGTADNVTYSYDYYSFDTNEYDTDSATLEDGSLTLREFGGNSVPNNIYIYPNSFDEKTEVTDYLDQWNDEDVTITLSTGTVLEGSERQSITYTDNVGVIITMIKSLINIVSYALIAFTGLSLVVSCFMIAIITYVSVIERVKEIGVIRSLGGSKKDVTHLFNAETFIIGLISGLIGIIITYIISAIINNVIGNLVDVSTISKFLWYQAVLMVVLSIALTVISGLLPSRSAAKQDPANALRSE